MGMGMRKRHGTSASLMNIPPCAPTSTTMASPPGKNSAHKGAEEVLKSAVVSVTSSKGALLLMLAGVQTGEIQAEFCSCAFESRKLAFFVVVRFFQWRRTGSAKVSLRTAAKR